MTDVATLDDHRPVRRRAGRPGSALPWICTAALLVGILGERMILRQPSADAAPYHQRVQAEAAKIPLHYGNWLGDDVPVPQGAVKLLKPNAILSRRYQHMASGQHVTVLLVQCRDARDILGHYPPICYPGQGWELVSAEPRDWSVSGRTIHGTRYVFKAPDSGELAIDNFMLLPDGRTARNMDEVEAAAQDLRRKFFGAAQVQLVYNAATPETRGVEIRQTFIGMLQPVIRAIAEQPRPPQAESPTQPTDSSGERTP